MDKKLHHFEQVKDVFDYGIELHAQLRTLYGSIGEQAEQERVRMLMDYLSSHERNREEAMQRFGRDPHANVFDVWLQYAPDARIEQMLKDCVIRPDMSVDDAVKIAMTFDNALIEIYKEAAREAQDTTAKAVFTNLVEMEEREQQRFIRDTEWFDDM
jgi:rubrerythrin